MVSGLPDSGNNTNSNDQSSFSRLCETEFHLKPNITFSKRLGQPGTTGAHRRLLIGLSSEEEALRITRLARNLRKSNDSFIASNVYINPHLSPEESKSQYEKRQTRRQQKSRISGDRNTHYQTPHSLSNDFPPLSGKSTLNPGVSSFPAPKATQKTISTSSSLSASAASIVPTASSSSIASPSSDQPSVNRPSSNPPSSIQPSSLPPSPTHRPPTLSPLSHRLPTYRPPIHRPLIHFLRLLRQAVIDSTMKV